jgi:hypothetical protein
MDGMVATRRVFPVVVDNLTPAWPQLVPLVTRALKGIVTHEPADVLRMLQDEHAQLWVQWSSRLEAMVVTEFAYYPQGRWLRLWLAASADDADFDMTAFEDVLSQFRDDNECRGFELIGRMGWLRRFPEARFVGVIMRTSA